MAVKRNVATDGGGRLTFCFWFVSNLPSHPSCCPVPRRSCGEAFLKRSCPPRMQKRTVPSPPPRPHFPLTARMVTTNRPRLPLFVLVSRSSPQTSLWPYLPPLAPVSKFPSPGWRPRQRPALPADYHITLSVSHLFAFSTGS